jgi:hypothetical protein
MSPKKAHEVFQSITYLSNLFDSLGIDPRGIRMVDIGAGQVSFFKLFGIPLLCVLIFPLIYCAKFRDI